MQFSTPSLSVQIDGCMACDNSVGVLHGFGWSSCACILYNLHSAAGMALHIQLRATHTLRLLQFLHTDLCAPLAPN